MKFLNFLKSLIRDKNDINEKTVVALITLVLIITQTLVELTFSFINNKPLAVNDYIFEGLLILTVSALGISIGNKALTYYDERKKKNKDDNNENLKEE